jgi:hypothetical protein
VLRLCREFLGTPLQRITWRIFALRLWTMNLLHACERYRRMTARRLLAEAKSRVWTYAAIVEFNLTPAIALACQGTSAKPARNCITGNTWPNREPKGRCCPVPDQ